MFSGSIVAIVTPLTPDGQLDWAAWDRLLDFHMSEGSDGIVVAGTTGESPSLSLEEIDALTRRAVLRCRGRTQVLVGTGTNSTAGTAARTRALSRLGVDGVLIVTPYYNKPPQEGLYRHFMAAADASAVPLVLYNVPGRTGVDLLPATVARLAAHPSVVAIKEATGSLERGRQILAECPAGFTLLGGDDATAIALIGDRRQRRHFGHRQCRAEAHARGVCSGTAAGYGRRNGDRFDPAGAASRFVHRSEPDSRKMGGSATGAHRRIPAPAARRVDAGTS